LFFKQFNLEKEGQQQQQQQPQPDVDASKGDEDAQNAPPVCCCSTDSTKSEEVVTFLCFSWKRKRRDSDVIRYGNQCEVHDENKD
jgi:hypothetical protein